MPDMQPQIDQENIILTQCSNDKAFVVCSGVEINSLQELLQFIKDSSEDDFLFHSNAHRCDFSNWVWDVMQDRVLATDLFVARGNRDRFSARLLIRLSELGEIDIL